MKPAGASSQPSGPAEFAAGAPLRLAPAIGVLLAGETLTAEQSAAAFEAIVTGQAQHGEIGALLALLATRTPTADEILGAARVMRSHVDPVRSSVDPDCIVDTAGTGGAPKTFNVSTVAAIVAAAAMRMGRSGTRCAVAKHGNRSRTGRGSAEVLSRLGVNIDSSRAAQARCLDEAGICFCFAIHHHPAARHAMPVRQSLPFPTVFNLLGPMTNPAGARRQLMGVCAPQFLRPIAEALAALGATRAMVVHSGDGLDEISISAPTRIAHVRDGRVEEETIDPAEVGLAHAPRAAVTARDLDDAARMAAGVINGTLHGPPRAMAMLNAGAALLVAGCAGSLAEGVALAAEALDGGHAARTLRRLAELSHG
jgi:anthranilate phosphoribosyltransferase